MPVVGDRGKRRKRGREGGREEKGDIYISESLSSSSSTKASTA